MPIEQLVKTVQKNPALSGAVAGLAGGALLSALAGKKTTKKLLQAGGLAAIGTVAWKGYQAYREREATNSDFNTSLDEGGFVDVIEESSAGAAVILDAMIAAAHADGTLSKSEKERIWHQAADLGLPPGEMAQLSDSLEAPAPIDDIAHRSFSDELRVEVYTASLIAMDETCEAGQHHLEKLRFALGMPAALVQNIHARVHGIGE